MGGLDFITIGLIVANVLVSLNGFKDYAFFEKYKFNVGRVKNGEQYRLFTSGFLHADTQHLLFNMITLFFFAPIVSAYLGMYYMLVVYVVSLFTGSVLSNYYHRHNYHYSAIGASGAVTGVLFSAILFEPFMKINFIIPAFLFGILYLGYSIYAMKKNNDNIGHAAHLGGAIGGYALTLILAPELLVNRPILTVVVGLPIVVLFVLLRLKKI